MKEIPLSQGKVALVDDEDFEYLNQWKWFAVNIHGLFYAVYKNGYMHRIVINAPKAMQVDHINHNGLDNRRENLRIVTNRENHHNRRKQSKSIGVQKNGNCYCAKINIKGKQIYLGNYKTIEEAERAYFDALNTICN